MRSLNPELLEFLTPTCDGGPIHFIGLGDYDFHIAYSTVRRIQTMVKAKFLLQGVKYVWEGGPTEIPVWLLIGQTPSNFEISSPFALRMNLTSGDWIEFYCDESSYEALIIDLGLKDGVIAMEVY